jgi:putative sugar O-methyltransferase
LIDDHCINLKPGQENTMLLSIENGFAQRPMQVDNTIIKRIIKAYNLSKAAQKEAGEDYQVGYMWLPIYEGFMKEIMAALSSGDEAAVARIYGNFFREPCSLGLHGMPVDMFKDYFSGNITEENQGKYIADLMHRFTIWLTSIGKSMPITALNAPDVGNPYGCFIDGNFYRAGCDYQHYYATMISRLVQGKGHKFTLEIGGGFGGLAYFMVRDNPDMTYIDLDLPENMALAAFFLLSGCPDKKIGLFGEVDLKSDDLSSYDALVLPNFAIQDFKDNSIDLVFNSYSLSEMPMTTVANYMGHFNRISKKFIYHINHTSITTHK